MNTIDKYQVRFSNKVTANSHDNIPKNYKVLETLGLQERFVVSVFFPDYDNVPGLQEYLIEEIEAVLRGVKGEGGGRVGVRG